MFKGFLKIAKKSCSTSNYSKQLILVILYRAWKRFFCLDFSSKLKLWLKLDFLLTHWQSNLEFLCMVCLWCEFVHSNSSYECKDSSFFQRKTFLNLLLQGSYKVSFDARIESDNSRVACGTLRIKLSS